MHPYPRALPPLRRPAALDPPPEPNKMALSHLLGPDGPAPFSPLTPPATPPGAAHHRPLPTHYELYRPPPALPLPSQTIPRQALPPHQQQPLQLPRQPPQLPPRRHPQHRPEHHHAHIAELHVGDNAQAHVRAPPSSSSPPSSSYSDGQPGGRAREPKTKRPWTEREDAQLRALAHRLGVGLWAAIAEHIHGRTGKQVRERWLNHLSPQVVKRPWSPAEDRIIIEAHSRYGNSWSKICKLLDGRSENMCKNRYHCKLSKLPQPWPPLPAQQLAVLPRKTVADPPASLPGDRLRLPPHRTNFKRQH